MKVVAASRRHHAWQLDGRGAARGRTERTAVIVEVRTERGARGLGEAAPLPGMSRDSLEDAERAIDALSVRVPFEVALEVDGARGAFAVAAELTSAPAARFAIELALIEALAAERGASLAQVLGAVRAASLPASVVVDTEDDARAAAGAPALKVKVGGAASFEEDLARIRAIAAAAPRARLRLDANGSWPRDAVHARLAALAGLPIDYIEEPCVDAHELVHDTALALPLALDESLAALLDLATGRTPGALPAVLRGSRLAAVIAKPTLLGVSGCLALAAHARTSGVPMLVTHCLESELGRAACAALAAALTVVPAVVTRDAAVSLAELAQLAPPAARALAPARAAIATPTVETIATVHAALAERRPLALLHAKLAPTELARQGAAVESASLPDDAAAILFTSGSTGAARGVVLSRSALDAAAEASARHLGWRAGDRWLLALSLAHAGGLAVVVRCRAAGRPVALVEDGGTAGALEALLATCMLASLVPTQLAALLEDPAWRPPPRLRAVLLGGAAASPALLAAAAARGVPFLTTYGMTETFGQIATMAPDRAGDPTAPLVLLPGAIVEAGTRAAPAPIRVRGPMLATQYLDGAPIAPAFVTADLGFLEDGALHIVGRADDVIVTGGEKIHPLEVEAVLAATPGLRAACVFGVPDARWGQVVGAALVADAGFDLAGAAARWHAALPPHARPRRLALIEQLPLTATGKPDRRAAAQLPTTPLDYPRAERPREATSV